MNNQSGMSLVHSELIMTRQLLATTVSTLAVPIALSVLALLQFLAA